MRETIKKVALWLAGLLLVIALGIGFPVIGFCLGYYVAPPGNFDRGERYLGAGGYYQRDYSGEWRKTSSLLDDEYKFCSGCLGALIGVAIGFACSLAATEKLDKM